jgi:hypothetical protein
MKKDMFCLASYMFCGPPRNSSRWANIFLGHGDRCRVAPPFQCLQVGIMLEQRLFIDVEIDHPKDIVIHPERKRALNSPSFFPMSTALALKLG